MSNFQISRWEVPGGENWLKITVVTKPLYMLESFYWYHHTNNLSGQGMKYAWWKMSQAGRPTIEVSKEGGDLLTELVYNHDPLKYLVDYFNIPEPTTEEGDN